MDTTVLKSAGFTQGEIKVYFALLELGDSTITYIAKKSGVTASKVYPILDRLISKGLVSYVTKSNVRHFVAEDPGRILLLLDERKNAIDRQKKQIEKIIPRIRQKKQEVRQKVRVFESFEGMKTLYDEILSFLEKTGNDFIAFSLGEEEYKFKESEHFFRKYDNERRNRKIPVRLLANIEQKEFMNKITASDRNISVKYVQLHLPNGVIIYGDNVATLMWSETPTAFVATSSQNAEAYRKFFEDLWRTSKK